jgi:hypothetical protein
MFAYVDNADDVILGIICVDSESCNESDGCWNCV